MPYTPMPPEYWRERRKNNERYREQERERDRRRRNTPARKSHNKASRERYLASEAGKAARRKHCQTRRSRLRGAFVEAVDPAVVFLRDNFVCQRCGIDCPIDAAVPASNAPTLDHIIALANGGEHSYENTQCLCFMCNSTKGSN